MYRKRRTLALENITLGVQKINEHNSSGTDTSVWHYETLTKKKISICYLTSIDGKSRRRGRPRGNSQPPLVFYQQAFIEAMGAAIATIAQASAAMGQGESSNLQRFKAHYPPTFMGGGDPMVAEHWFR